jgi:glycosyltransferase involved in cell wall biosynthesis
MTASGWFSDRSAEYLASGRPVVVQQTGFSQWLEVHRGVVAFGSPAEAVEAIEKVNRDYEAHCRAARVVAEAYFDARLVLTSLLQRASRAVHAA